jgi:hypothetical protein
MSRILDIIGREDNICELAIRRLKEKCVAFEKKYHLSSDDFFNLWLQGKVGDEVDYFEWKALIEGMEEWRQTKEDLKKLEVA